MSFTDIIGLDYLKHHLKTTADHKRVPHAQLFVGPDGRGTLAMAMAYAEYLLSSQKEAEAKDFTAKAVRDITHPDLHFVYPSSTNKTIKKDPRAIDFISDWRSFVKERPYGNLYQWYQHLGIENKQGKIRIQDARKTAQDLSLKSYDGGFKIVIIWHAELMNVQTSNYLLKLIEEPPAKTLFILTTDAEEKILETIRSRCQKLNFPPIGEAALKEALIENYDCSPELAQKYAVQAEGDYAKAVQLTTSNEDDLEFEKWFIDWVRTAFSAAGNKSSILKILSWSETIAKTNRETQKRFLNYCIEFMRQALLQNYKAKPLVYLEPSTKNFKLEKFAPFIHGQNILDITHELETAIYHIERNGNSKIILTDLSIKLTRLLHRKMK